MAHSVALDPGLLRTETAFEIGPPVFASFECVRVLVCLRVSSSNRLLVDTFVRCSDPSVLTELGCARVFRVRASAVRYAKPTVRTSEIVYGSPK